MKRIDLFRSLKINYWCAACPEMSKQKALLRCYCPECRAAFCYHCSMRHDHVCEDMRKQYVPMNRMGPKRKVAMARPALTCSR